MLTAQLKAQAAEHARKEAEAKEHLRALREYGYRFLPIGALPAEVLLDIMRQLVEEWAQVPQRKPTDKSVDLGLQGSTKGLHPLKLAAVCRAWRNLAMGTPALWRYIKTDSKTDSPFLEFIIKQTSQSPISIQIPGTRCMMRSSRNEDLMKDLLASITRLEYVYVQSIPFMLNKLLSGTANTAATALKYLRFDREEITGLPGADDPDEYEISRSPYDQGTPNLETLEIYGWTIPWDSPLLRSPRLRRLILHHTTPSHNHDNWLVRLQERQSDVSALLHLLEEHPQLHTAHFTTLFTLSASAPQATTPVDAKGLRDLEVRGSLAALAALFQRLRLSTLIENLGIYAIYDRSDPDYRTLARSLEAAFSDNDGPIAPQQLQIDLRTGITPYYMRLWNVYEERNVRALRNEEARKPTDSLKNHIKFLNGQHMSALQEAEWKLLREPWMTIAIEDSPPTLRPIGGLFLSQDHWNLESLVCAELRVPLHPGVWSVLAELPRLEELFIDCLQGRECLYALTPRSKDGNPRPFPALRLLYVEFLGRGSEEVEEADLIANAAGRVLAGRQVALGKKLGRLRLANWPKQLTAEQTEALSRDVVLLACEVDGGLEGFDVS